MKDMRRVIKVVLKLTVKVELKYHYGHLSPAQILHHPHPHHYQSHLDHQLENINQIHCS